MLELSKRFAEALTCKPNYLSVSFPILSDGKEIIFFYHAFDTALEIETVVFRDIKSSALSIKPASEILTKNELNSLRPSTNKKYLQDPKVFELSKRFYELHELVLAMDFNQSPSVSEIAILKEYLDIFNEIVQKSDIRKIYYSLGKSGFDHIQKMAYPRGEVSFFQA